MYMYTYEHTGMICGSNVTEGFILLNNDNSFDMRVELHNDALNSIPFATKRLLSNRDAVLRATSNHEEGHPDREWIHKHFSWKSKPNVSSEDIEPPLLWGTHNNEKFISRSGRELGISSCIIERLSPELVNISAMEPGAPVDIHIQHP